jgi:amino acid permease
MNDKLQQSCVGSIVTWTLTLWSWFGEHSGAIVALFAVGASIFTMLAAWESRKLSRKRQDLLDIPDTEDEL